MVLALLVILSHSSQLDYPQKVEIYCAGVASVELTFFWKGDQNMAVLICCKVLKKILNSQLKAGIETSNEHEARPFVMHENNKGA